MRHPYARFLLALAAGMALSLLFRQHLSARNSSADVYGPFPLPAAVPYGPRPQKVEITEAERTSREIIRTDRLISDSDGRVSRNGNEKAKGDLKSAHSRQAEAKEAHAQMLFARSARLTLEARAFMKSALIQLGPAENDPELARRALDQTDDALQRAKDVLEDGAPTNQKRSYARLKTHQEEARRLYRNGSVRLAYAETREVRAGVLDLLRQCADLPVSRETAKRALKRAEAAMEQARREMGGTRSASGALRLERQAELQLGKARSAFARKGYRDALLHSKLVERHLQRAMDARRLATTAQSG